MDFWSDIIQNYETGTLIRELYRRHPELIGPVKDELELAGLFDYVPSKRKADYSHVYDPKASHSGVI